MGNCSCRLSAVSSVSNAPPRSTASEQFITSTIRREGLINLHSEAKSSTVFEVSNASIDVPDDFLQQQIGGRGRDADDNINRIRLRNIFSSSPRQILAGYTAPVIPKTAAERQCLERCLSEHFVFSAMTGTERTLLINAMEYYRVKRGYMIIEEGDIGDYFYILHSGTVTFLKGGEQVGHAREGEGFGELGLLYDCLRAASARADADCMLFRVDQKTFRALLANNTAQSSQENIAVLRKVDFFKDMDTSTLTKISDALITATFRDGTRIFRKGEVGTVFYIVKEGKVILSDIVCGETKYVDQFLTTGDFFGERALLTGEKRAANVKAVGDCALLCLSKETFEKILGPLQTVVDNATYKLKIKGVPVFAKASLEQFEVDELAKRLRFVDFQKGAMIANEDDHLLSSHDARLTGLFFIVHGEITQTKRDGSVRILSKGDYFGELCLQKNTNREEMVSWTLIATEETRCKAISLNDIEDAIGCLDRLEETCPIPLIPLDSTIELSALEKHSMIGNGTYGQVWLVSHIKTKQPYALKIQNKKELVKSGQVEGVLREKNLMTSIDHPFLIKVVNTFQDEKNVFMVLKLVQGGELFNILRARHNGIPEQHAQFYAACILEGLSYMHRRNIVYRDLKPENVLIDSDGYCVLVDFGFAKVVLDKAYTLCGTPVYLAPEIILSRGYDKAIDHWAFGVIVYEMILGCSPFYSRRIDQTILFKRIVEVRYRFPEWFKGSNESKDLVESLLILEPSERLGCRCDEDIIEHQWFSSINRESLLSKRMRPPWIPTVESPLDARHFNSNELFDNQHSCSMPPLTEEEQTLFKNF